MYFNLTISHRFYEMDNIKTERLRTTYGGGQRGGNKTGQKDSWKIKKYKTTKL